ncbi:MAG: DUF1697 domain-containing protein [Planctomycetaceae bacterium]
MSTLVLLLRGINVGKSTRVPMADLREVLTNLGCTSVTTLLNSGNAVVKVKRTTPTAFGARATKALAQKFGWQIPVVTRSAEEFRAIADANPFASECKDDSKLLIVFAETVSLLSSLKPSCSSGEKFALADTAGYLLCSGPLLESVAAKSLLSHSGQAITTRNWATVKKIRCLLDQDDLQ